MKTKREEIVMEAARERAKNEMLELKQHPAWARYYIATCPENRKKYRRYAGTRTLPPDIREKIEAMAYETFFSESRLRKTYEGKNAYPRVRTETNGRSGWDCVSWHYADYFAVIAPNGKKIYINVGKGYDYIYISEHFSSFAGEKSRREKPESPPVVITHRATRRGLKKYLRMSRMSIQYDRETSSPMFITATGEKYHFTPSRFPKNEFRRAVNAFRKRRQEKIEEKQFMQRAQTVFVGVADSIAAGNCVTETEKFANQYYSRGIGAVRGDAILRMRDDRYTRRAVARAIERINNNSG